MFTNYNLLKWLKKNIALLYIAIILVVNIFFTTLPLLNTLHFEVAFLNSILLSFLSGLLILSFLKHDESRIKIFTNKTYFYSLLIFLIVLFLISLVATIFCQDCPISDGIYFYLIITLPSVIIGTTVGFFARDCICISCGVCLFCTICLETDIIFRRT